VESVRAEISKTRGDTVLYKTLRGAVTAINMGGFNWKAVRRGGSAKGLIYQKGTDNRECHLRWKDGERESWQRRMGSRDRKRSLVNEEPVLLRFDRDYRGRNCGG